MGSYKFPDTLADRTGSQVCHCEGALRPWQSREGSYVFAGSAQLSGQVLRDSHVASLLGMTHQVGAAVHQCPYAVEYSCTGRTRKGHAATDAIGSYRFIARLFVSPVRRRERHAAPLQFSIEIRKKLPEAQASGNFSLSKKSLWAFSPSCFQNCKINFCSMILQFCRCGGLFNAKGNPDGFLSHFPSLRNFRLGRFL